MLFDSEDQVLNPEFLLFLEVVIETIKSSEHYLLGTSLGLGNYCRGLG